jgi:broad specificity phosphatase PhoE
LSPFLLNHVNNKFKVVHFVMNLHTMPRTFYLTRHGQSEYNLLGKIGGDSGLTPAGIEYARRLAQFAKEYIAKEDIESEDEETTANEGEALAPGRPTTTSASGAYDSPNTLTNLPEAFATPPPTSPIPYDHKRSPSSFRLSSLGRPIDKHGPIPCRLWTSTLRRTKETAQFIEHNTIQYTWDNGDTAEWVQFRAMPRRNLDELYAGVCDGMTYKEIEQVYPEEFARRQDDKLAYRYPRGTIAGA